VAEGSNTNQPRGGQFWTLIGGHFSVLFDSYRIVESITHLVVHLGTQEFARISVFWCVKGGCFESFDRRRNVSNLKSKHGFLCLMAIEC